MSIDIIIIMTVKIAMDTAAGEAIGVGWLWRKVVDTPLLFYIPILVTRLRTAERDNFGSSWTRMLQNKK